MCGLWSGVRPPMLTLLSCPAISHPQAQLCTLGGSIYNIITHNSLKTITPLTHRRTDRQTDKQRHGNAAEEKKECGVIGSSCTVAANPSLAPWGLCPSPGRPARPLVQNINFFFQPLQEIVNSFSHSKRRGGPSVPGLRLRTCTHHSLRCISMTYLQQELWLSGHHANAPLPTWH